jgi:hypothetical protein
MSIQEQEIIAAARTSTIAWQLKNKAKGIRRIIRNACQKLCFAGSYIKRVNASCNSLTVIHHSVLRFLIGFAIAAFIAWKLIVMTAINSDISPAPTNIHQLISIR